MESERLELPRTIFQVRIATASTYNERYIRGRIRFTTKEISC